MQLQQKSERNRFLLSPIWCYLSSGTFVMQLFENKYYVTDEDI